MREFKPVPIEMEHEKMQFLEEIAARYALADPGKVVRCLINYARENPDKHQDIFEEVRCVNC